MQIAVRIRIGKQRSAALLVLAAVYVDRAVFIGFDGRNGDIAVGGFQRIAHLKIADIHDIIHNFFKYVRGDRLIGYVGDVEARAHRAIRKLCGIDRMRRADICGERRRADRHDHNQGDGGKAFFHEMFLLFHRFYCSDVWRLECVPTLRV